MPKQSISIFEFANHFGLIWLNGDKEAMKRKIFENMNGCTFVEICEELAYYDKAVNYLKVKAAENRIRCDKKLFAGLEYGVGYLTPELNEMFDEWYSKKLKNWIIRNKTF